MTSSSWGDLGLEEAEHEHYMVLGHPLVPIAIGVVLVFVIGIVLCNVIPVGVHGHIGAASLIALAVAAGIWTLLWFVDLKRSSTAWGIGAAVIFLLCAMLVVAGASIAASIADRRDAAMLNDIRINAEGEPELPGGQKPGPIASLGFAYIRGMVAESRKRQTILMTLGLDRLTDASALDAAPELMTDCDRFARAKPKVAASDKVFKGLIARFRADLDVKVTDPAVHKAVLKGIDQAIGSNQNQIDRVGGMLQAQLDQAGGLCRLFAQRNWRPQGASFMFTRQADLDAFDRLITPWNKVARDLADLQSQARMRSYSRIDPNWRP